ncbi:MAG TPA: hypothetical protein VN673_02780 [Clostridia bacterium]|nr:hypothetical protein [Clostridia bacterium]
MPDCFALLGLPRRPWLDPEDVQGHFLKLSAPVHPDRLSHASDVEKQSSQRAFADLNAAQLQLRSPKERLLHLLELESGKKPQDLQQIPPPLVQLFVDAGNLCRAADDHLARRSTLNSPLLKLQTFERGQELLDQLSALQHRLHTWRDQLDAALKEADGAWEQASGADDRRRLLPQLEDLYRLYAFNTRWSQQVQERALRLSLD